MSRANPWQLYETVPGWSAVSNRLELRLRVRLDRLDKAIKDDLDVRQHAVIAWNSMVGVLSDYSRFGADDTEPRAHLAYRIRKHLRDKGYKHIELDF
jgi:hypothetical protein